MSKVEATTKPIDPLIAEVVQRANRVSAAYENRSMVKKDIVGKLEFVKKVLQDYQPELDDDDVIMFDHANVTIFDVIELVVTQL